MTKIELRFELIKVTTFSTTNKDLQVNLCQKLLFLHQPTHNMTKDCSCCGLIDAKIRASDKDLPV